MTTFSNASSDWNRFLVVATIPWTDKKEEKCWESYTPIMTNENAKKIEEISRKLSKNKRFVCVHGKKRIYFQLSEKYAKRALKLGAIQCAKGVYFP